MDETQQDEGLRRFEGVAAVVLTLVGWSAVPLFLRHFAEEIDAWTSNGWRYGFAAVLWAPVLVVGAWRGTLPGGLWRLALVPSVINALGQVCFTWAHYKIDPGMLTFALRLQIVFVAAGALLLFPVERRVIRSAGFVVGIGVVMLGTVGTVALGEGGGGASTAFGVTLAVLAGLFFAAYGLSVRWYMRGMPPFIAFSAISQYTAVVMVVLMLAIGERAGLTALELGAGQFGLLLVSAVVGIALGHVCYYTAIAKLGVAVSSGVIQLQPFFVAVGSGFLFAEVLTAGQWFSGLLAVLGAALVLRTQHVVTRRIRAERAARGVDGAVVEDLPADKVAAAAEAEEDEAVGGAAR